MSRVIDGAQEARFIAYARGIGMRRALSCLARLAEAEERSGNDTTAWRLSLELDRLAGIVEEEKDA